MTLVSASTKAISMFAIALALVLATEAPASADAAGPTDYKSEIISVTGDPSSFDIRIIGGDAFVELTLRGANEITILGYQGEPYLRFDASGAVWENQRSPAKWLNEDRYGSNDPPTYANAEEPPVWDQIANNGRWAWHDHRTHWMNEVRPPGAEPGDQILEAVIPAVVDGARVEVAVASYLLDPPARWPIALAAVVGVCGILAIVRGTRVAAMALGLTSALLAAALGAWAVVSVPAETGPSPLLWQLPALAVVSALTALVLRGRLQTTVYLDGLILISGAAIAAWSWQRRAALTSAFIPSGAPAELDRLAIAAGLLVACGVAARGALGLARPARINHD